MKIVCDTNVLISGVLFGGPPRQILSLVARGTFVNVTSTALLREAEDVLLRPKFGLHPEEVACIIALFRDSFECVYPTHQVKAISIDPDDNMLLEAAMASSADAIVSGDKHLLDLKEWNGIEILSPGDFIKKYEC